MKKTTTEVDERGLDLATILSAKAYGHGGQSIVHDIALCRHQQCTDRQSTLSREYPGKDAPLVTKISRC